MKIRLNVGLSDATVAALGLRAGREQFGQTLELDSTALLTVPLIDAQVPGATTQAVDADKAWSACAFLGNVAAVNNLWQIKNPSGSGRTVYLDGCLSWFGSGGPMSIRRYDTDLTTVVAVANKRGGGGSFIARFSTQNNIATPGGAVELCSLVGQSTGPAAGSGHCDFSALLKEPLRMDPGVGYILTNNTVNTTGFCTFWGREY